ncbi:hypothetical protein MNBD_NITROSPINAE02-1676, partial [hydrothermal vent metagenome]
MGSFEVWQKWLFTAGVLIAVIGVVLALSSGTFLVSAFNKLAFQAFWEGREIPEEAIALALALALALWFAIYTFFSIY